MMEFALWFVAQVPAFLMAPPISGLVGLGMLSVVVGLFNRICNINQ